MQLRVQVAGILLVMLAAPGLMQLGAAAPCYPAMFVFGDSLADTGNGVLSGNAFFLRTAQKPYGETVPGNPFRRFSDGLLLIDFLAMRLGLPLLNPFLDKTANFNMGVNYAVSGATADRVSKYITRFILPLTPYSLDVQLSWHLALTASGPSPQKPNADAYKDGLYVVEIGGNDYLSALNALVPNSPSKVISTFVPAVISKIGTTTEALYANGARHFLFISIPPLGCSPSILSGNPTGPKDSNGCLQEFNAISVAHGMQLFSLVNGLRSKHSDATFAFLDYYGAFYQTLAASASLGFTDTLDACCGAGPKAPNRYDRASFCSASSIGSSDTLCPDPNVFFTWDGIHFTHKLNSEISRLTFEKGSFLDPPNAFAACGP
ncbi:hypothetical protein L7F22_056736 [Adiantum nelumboides]|nr:hypothetical protein [Adiantum nelumboides]